MLVLEHRIRLSRLSLIHLLARLLASSSLAFAAFPVIANSLRMEAEEVIEREVLRALRPANAAL